MLDIPEDLKTNWFVLPRPEGQRALVIASRGITISRLRNGRTLHTFPSALPNGNRISSLGSVLMEVCFVFLVYMWEERVNETDKR